MQEPEPEYIFLKNVSSLPKFKSFFSKETDRGCALLAASLLDNELQKLLTKNFLAESKLHKKLFQANGTLGNLSSKIDLTYALGFASKKAYTRMHKIREIRNVFGHSFEPLDFDDQSISQKLMSISLGHHSKRHRYRTIFIDLVNKILIEIYVQTYLANEVYEPEYVEANPNEFILRKKKELIKGRNKK